MSNLPSQTAKQEALMEFSALGQPDHLPLGMYIFPTEVFRWSGVISIHKGYYSGAIFHFTLTIPPTYPQSIPQIIFDSPSVFHPLVDPVSGKMRLDSRFPNWRPRQDFIWTILHFVKASFKRRTLDDLREPLCANVEAYRLYREQTTSFAKIASQSASLSTSSSTLYGPPPSRTTDPSPSPFQFRKLEKGEKEELKRKVKDLALTKIVKP
ncbi:uncharacterized protein JCM6883_002586 [Sporobolomyces salmoneus]|uniref:uncharacterized protein n=1 Tax=Sporobolomyces salmoneus TaxID=183962 RepID=UPI003174762F